LSPTSTNIFEAARKRGNHLELLLLVAISLVLWRHPLVDTFKLALASDAHTHILLIVPLVLALSFVRVREASATVAGAKWTGALIMILALLLRGLTVSNIAHLSNGNELSLSMFALVVWWIGSVGLCYGIQMFRTLLFPLCFLFLVVPLPESALDWITQTLQYQSAAATELLFRAVHIPVTRDGVFLTIPGLGIEVAQECSSIRSSTILIVITLVLANLFLRAWWRQVLLVAIAVPLSVAKNAIRIFTIAELGTRVDPGYLDGRFHRHGGIVFLGLALLVVIGLLWMLRRSEVRRARTLPNAALQRDRPHGFSISDRSTETKL
jgi:exosortase